MFRRLTDDHLGSETFCFSFGRKVEPSEFVFCFVRCISVLSIATFILYDVARALLRLELKRAQLDLRHSAKRLLHDE